MKAMKCRPYLRIKLIDENFKMAELHLGKKLKVKEELVAHHIDEYFITLQYKVNIYYKMTKEQPIRNYSI